ncbi:hypothetical protein [Chelativorans sp. AA-79]|uniref:ImuA family protein n=1 Tax=Chelativorans sp. AA-79 TaxID=3028735 RepID=UPI0023F812F1|nr:hypothetical protein [Chelativorans sp. AA-79]WEX09702.1 hypothetical protein PVE73_01645 [Chelativorans sp. AA-79]
MARMAMAQEKIFALRREIARIEGTLPERLVAPEAGSAVVLRRGISAVREGRSAFLGTGVPGLDSALAGGVPQAALTEFHSLETRDAGATAGFALALVSLLRKTDSQRQGKSAVCWIGMANLFREAGFPYAPGLERQFGLSPGDLLFSTAEHLADALWIAKEAARLKDFCAVVLEIRGNPARLDLTATRRLHRRAQEAGRPVFLIREGALAEPTAALVRLEVSAAPAVPRRTVAGPLGDAIGHPAFTVVIGKSRTARPGRFILEWNPDEHSLREIRPAHSRALVPASGHRPYLPAAGGTVVALRPAATAPTAGDQQPREERPTHRRPRRAS